MMDDRARLRAAIRHILVELDAGDSGGAGGGSGYGGGGGMMSGAGYGMMNYGGSLKDVFIKPFTDVVQTVKGVATELVTQAKAAVQVSIEIILSSLIPLYQTNYSAIFKQMDKSLGEVKKKYEKVYQANDEAFRNKDARFLAFLYDPSAWVTAKTLESSPAAIASVLEVFTDGAVGAGSHLLEAIRYLRELEMEVKGVSRYHRMVPQRLRRQAHTNRDMMPWESRTRGSGPILEAEVAPPATGVDPQQAMAQKIRKILSNPELKKEIAASPTAQAMRADGQRILATVTGQLSKDIAELKSVNTLDDITRLAQGRVQLPDMSKVPPEEKQAADAAVVTSTKQALGEFYRKSLEGGIKQAQAEGVGNENAYVRTLMGLLAKVGS